jgi:hypothetical protein
MTVMPKASNASNDEQPSQAFISLLNIVFATVL